MALFSWFIGNQKAQKIAKKNSQLDEKIESFTANTMWPTAQVRRNQLVKQQESKNAIDDKKSQINASVLKTKES